MQRNIGGINPGPEWEEQFLSAPRIEPATGQIGGDSPTTRAGICAPQMNGFQEVLRLSPQPPAGNDPAARVQPHRGDAPFYVLPSKVFI